MTQRATRSSLSKNPDRQKVRGKALRVTENSVKDHGSFPLPAPPEQGSGDPLKEHKVEGKALRVNENSVDDQEPARSPVPPGKE